MWYISCDASDLNQMKYDKIPGKYFMWAQNVDSYVSCHAQRVWKRFFFFFHFIFSSKTKKWSLHSKSQSILHIMAFQVPKNPGIPHDNYLYSTIRCYRVCEYEISCVSVWVCVLCGAYECILWHATGIIWIFFLSTCICAYLTFSASF